MADSLSERQLRDWLGKVEKEIGGAELEFRKVEQKLSELRGKRAALLTLLGTDRAVPMTRTQPEGNGHAPYTAYDRPILEALVQLGGKGDADSVLRRFKSIMEERCMLGPEDYKDVPGGTEERWRNTARWRRAALVKLGLLQGNSARGVWEISDKGRQWLAGR